MEVRKSAALSIILQMRPDESSIHSSMRLAVFEKTRIVEVNSYHWIVEILKLCPIHAELQSKGEAAERP